MRRSLFIISAILAYLLLCSKSCDSDEQENSAAKEAELTQTKEAIKNEFESDDLSKKSLRAFEAKAEQKLVDLVDYLHIYDDKAMDESFKDQAQQMILDLFISDSVVINSALSNDNNEKILLLKDFLHAGSSPGYTSEEIMIDSIQVVKPFRRTDEFYYTGSLKFSRRVMNCTSSDTVVSEPARMEAEIFVSKVKKLFGADTLQVWGVFLGDINLFICAPTGKSVGYE
jgi:hypothetical protein